MQCYPLTAEAPEKYATHVVNQYFSSDVTLTSSFWQQSLKNVFWQGVIGKYMPCIAAITSEKFLGLFLHLFSTTRFLDHAVKTYPATFLALDAFLYFMVIEILNGEAEP